MTRRISELGHFMRSLVAKTGTCCMSHILVVCILVALLQSKIRAHGATDRLSEAGSIDLITRKTGSAR